MAETVMILRGTADGGRTPYDGQYLKDFDFEAANGQGEITMTPDLGQAKRFPNFMAAITYRNTVPKCRPLRPDLQPNRPLTATNWEIVEAARLGAVGDGSKPVTHRKGCNDK
jgi:hypothetical protein